MTIVAAGMFDFGMMAEGTDEEKRYVGPPPTPAKRFETDYSPLTGWPSA